LASSFVERATLLVKDSSTGAIRKINAELKKLFDISRKLKSTKIDFAAESHRVTQL